MLFCIYEISFHKITKIAYKNDNSREVLELKEELKEHLILSANEFIDKGYCEEESYKMAIEKFDGGSDMLKELYITLKENTDENIKHNNKVKIFFRNTFIIGSLISILAFWSPISVDTYFLDKISAFTEKVENKITKIINTKDINNVDTYKNELDKMLNSEEFKDVLSLKVYTNISTPPMDDKGNITPENSTYTYKSKISPHSISYSSESSSKLNGKSSSDNKIFYVINVNESHRNIIDEIFADIVIVTIISLIIYVYLLLKQKFKYKFMHL